jgi:hypothetical protein
MARSSEATQPGLNLSGRLAQPRCPQSAYDEIVGDEGPIENTEQQRTPVATRAAGVLLGSGTDPEPRTQPLC